jgi:hypothetical protein
MSDESTRIRIIVFVGSGFALLCFLIALLFYLDKITVPEIQDILYIVGPTLTGFFVTILSYLGLISIGGDLRTLSPEMVKLRGRIVLALIFLLFSGIIAAIVTRGIGKMRFDDLKTILAIITSGIAGLVSASLTSYFRTNHGDTTNE